jgi:hypothetical protein
MEVTFVTAAASASPYPGQATSSSVCRRGRARRAETAGMAPPLLASSYYDNGVWRSTDRRDATASRTTPSSTPSSTRSSVVDLEPEADPPRVLAIGPDRAGNLLEIVWLEFTDQRPIVIHAMSLRPKFYDLLPGAEEEE